VRGVQVGQTQSGSAMRLRWPALVGGCACVHEKGRASSRTTRRSLHRAERHHGRRCLGSPQQNAGELGSIEDTERKRVGLDRGHGKKKGRLVGERQTRAHARVHGRVEGCEGVCNGARGTHRHQDCGGGPDGGATRLPDEKIESAKERTASRLRARRSRQRHMQETASQPGLKAGITQHDGAAATRQSALG
jgi:hypothetical protein